MNTLPITMTNPADSHNNHSACAGKKGLGDNAPQQAKCKSATFALLATMLRYYAPGPFSGEHGTLLPKKEISFRENFWPRNPSKTVISENQAVVKMPVKPYAATLSEVFKT